ncbi:hypothetical protein Egran_01666 [Elaphomyces granulatus]|uniref:Myb-like domain-containing protein n=1 Tax=Elaphomyces granulatus TaxID=519963 RepID=A0A232M2D1_9EURO|nr:hypothetical protein Egran_01666 [Elaphomyces granulatus]
MTHHSSTSSMHPSSPEYSSAHHLGQTEYKVYKHHRRVSSTGGGRAWTEEEEAYLLRTRLHKMPYKHIAAHLKKTELACRLHYHQMSYGSNRRKRTNSVSSSGSCASTVGQRDTTPEHSFYMRLSPVTSPCNSPKYISEDQAAPGAKVSQQPQQRPIPILPKLDMMPVQSPQSTTANLAKSLSLDISFAVPSSQKCIDDIDNIDPARVRALYRAHCSSFWSLIASEYSHNSAFSGRQLEEAFFLASMPPTTTRVPSPPTPASSPQNVPLDRQPPFNGPGISTVQRSGFQAINGTTPSEKNVNSRPSLAERCAVSALLTVEKEVRPSKNAFIVEAAG